MSKDKLSLPSSNRRGRTTFAKKLLQDSQGGVLPLFVAATVLHVGLVLLMFAVGRAAIFPNLIDRYAILAPLSSDSHTYQIEGTALAATLTDAGFSAWAATPTQIHIKLFSLLFVLFGSAFGPSILSVEPLNLAAYLIILSLVFKLGEEVGNRRVGLIAACAVAVWPSFLLHTTQLLKDPLYIAAALALTFVASTWLTRTYNWRAALVRGASGGAIIGALSLIRDGSGAVVLTVVSLGIILLTLRQLREARLLGWNSFSAFLVFVFMLTFLTPGVVRFRSLKPEPSAAQVSSGPSDNQQAFAAQSGALPQASPDPTSERSDALLSRLKSHADLDAARVGRLRRGFTHWYFDAGSTVDREVEFNNSFDVIHYLPRAMALGFFSPFPEMWFGNGKNTGVAGRIISGGETMAIYVIELLALIGLWRARHRLQAWLLLLVTTFGVTILGLVVANIGTLYRMRYVFWILLIILGAKGFDDLMAKRRRPVLFK